LADYVMSQTLGAGQDQRKRSGGQADDDPGNLEDASGAFKRAGQRCRHEISCYPGADVHDRTGGPGRGIIQGTVNQAAQPFRRTIQQVRCLGLRKAPRRLPPCDAELALHPRRSVVSGSSRDLFAPVLAHARVLVLDAERFDHVDVGLAARTSDLAPDQHETSGQVPAAAFDGAPHRFTVRQPVGGQPNKGDRLPRG
jgi:hypothetical protein